MTQPESDRTCSVIHSLDSDGSAEVDSYWSQATQVAELDKGPDWVVVVGIDPAEPVAYAFVATDGTRAVVLETGTLRRGYGDGRVQWRIGG